MKLSQVVKKVIKLAEAIRRYWDRELPKRYANYPLVNPGESDGPPPPEKETLRQFLTSLPEDMLYKLALIHAMWLKSLDRYDLEAVYQEMHDRYETPEEVVDHLMWKAALADELTDGLAELKRHNISVDKLNFAPIKSRN